MSMHINLQYVFKMSASRTHAALERLLRTRLTFSEAVMVSVGGSKLGCTELFFYRAMGENKWCLLSRHAADAEVIASH